MKENEVYTAFPGKMVYTSRDLRIDLQDKASGKRTGISKIDEFASIHPGLTVIAGEPGAGKTMLMLNILNNLLNEYENECFAFFSYEEPTADLYIKLLMIRSGVVLNEKKNFEAYEKYLRPSKEEPAKSEQTVSGTRRIKAAWEDLDAFASSGRLLWSREDHSIDGLCQKIKSLADGNGKQLGAIFIDYIQKVKTAQHKERYLELKDVSEKLSDLAVGEQALNVPMIVGAQLNQQKTVRESNDIVQDATLLLRIVKDKGSDSGNAKARTSKGRGKGTQNKLKITIDKNRRGVSGEVLSVSHHPPCFAIGQQKVADRRSRQPQRAKKNTRLVESETEVPTYTSFVMDE